MNYLSFTQRKPTPGLVTTASQNPRLATRQKSAAKKTFPPRTTFRLLLTTHSGFSRGPVK